MPPPVSVDLPPPVEHVWTVDRYGRPIEIKKISHAPAEQLLYENNCIRPYYQLDIFFDLMKAVKDEDIKRIIAIIDALPESFRAQTKKLFAEVGELKKKNYQLQIKNESMQEQIDFLYDQLNIKKRGFDDFSTESSFFEF